MMVSRAAGYNLRPSMPIRIVHLLVTVRNEVRPDALSVGRTREGLQPLRFWESTSIHLEGLV
jgi:hypothetical protein